MLLWTHAQDSSPMSSSSFSFHSIAHERVLFQRDPVSGSNCALGGKNASRWTSSNPFRPDKFGNRIAIFVSIFDQIIHVSHSRSRERQPKLFAAPQGFTEDRREGRNIGWASHGSAHVGIVPLQPFAKAEPPAYSDLEVDPVRPQRAPGGDPAIRGDHHAVDEAGTAKPVEAEAQIRLLHD